MWKRFPAGLVAPQSHYRCNESCPGLRIAAGEQLFMPQPDQFLGQIRNNSLRAAVLFGRNALVWGRLQGFLMVDLRMDLGPINRWRTDYARHRAKEMPLIRQAPGSELKRNPCALADAPVQASTREVVMAKAGGRAIRHHLALSRHYASKSAQAARRDWQVGCSPKADRTRSHRRGFSSMAGCPNRS